MSAAQIVSEVRLRTGCLEPDASRAVVAACASVLRQPSLPGNWWAEQIILEATRILREPV